MSDEENKILLTVESDEPSIVIGLDVDIPVVQLTVEGNSAEQAEKYAKLAKTYAAQSQQEMFLARDWAIKMDGLVDNNDYSAKYYANQAATAAQTASDKAELAVSASTLAAQQADRAKGYADSMAEITEKADEAISAAEQATNTATQAAQQAAQAAEQAQQASSTVEGIAETIQQDIQSINDNLHGVHETLDAEVETNRRQDDYISNIGDRLASVETTLDGGNANGYNN